MRNRFLKCLLVSISLISVLLCFPVCTVSDATCNKVEDVSEQSLYDSYVQVFSSPSAPDYFLLYPFQQSFCGLFTGVSSTTANISTVVLAHACTYYTKRENLYFQNLEVKHNNYKTYQRLERFHRLSVLLI